VGVSLTTHHDDRGSAIAETNYSDYYQGDDGDRKMSLVKGFFCGVVLSHVPTSGGDKRLTRGCLLSWVRPADSFMGNLSVNKDQPGFAPKSISHFFYTVVKKDAIKDCPFLMGTPFQGNTHQCLKDAMTLDGRSQYAIVAVDSHGLHEGPCDSLG